jgi:putative PIN family toxin of toxin-antitoxin system
MSAYVRPEGVPGQIVEQFLRHAAFELVLSAEIAAEILHALAYPKVRKAARSKIEPELWFEDILALAEMIPGQHRVGDISSDPDDDKYVAAAIEGRAAFVVSGDPDLLEIGRYAPSWIFSLCLRHASSAQPREALPSIRPATASCSARARD